jgi:hypothetical protein
MTWRAFVHLLVALLGLAGVRQEDVGLPEKSKDGVTRRTFLRALGVSAAGLAALPSTWALDELLDFDDPVSFLDLDEVTNILKEVYLPVIREQLNSQSLFSQFYNLRGPVHGGITFRIPLERK